MKRLSCLFACALILAVLAPRGAWAAEKEKGVAPSKKSLKTIDMEFRTWGGLKYMHEGKKLKGMGDFKSVIGAAGDAEADRMLAVSKSSRGASALCGLLGVSAVIAGIISLPDHADLFDDGAGTGTALTMGGAGLILVGNLFNTRADTARFNAVQRYNQVVLSAKLRSF